MSAGEKSCSLLSKTVVRPSISLTEGIQILGPVLPPPPNTNAAINSHLVHACFMSCWCCLFVQQYFSRYSAKKGYKEILCLCRRKVPWGRLHKTMISSNQRAKREKIKGGCKKDGTETGDG